MSRLKTVTAVAVLSFALCANGATQASAKFHHQRRDHHLRAPISENTGPRSFSGVASFYGNESGSKMASGQRFNQYAMTAAHRSLPFGTKLKVTHGGRSVVVTINDRGPFIRGRVLDLSRGAARAVGLNGVGMVIAQVM